MSDMELLLKAKDDEIKRLTEQVTVLQNKLFELLTPKKKDPNAPIRKPMTYDTKTKSYREKTDEEMNADAQALKELEII